MRIGIRQIEPQLHAPLRLQRHDGLHRYALLAQVQNHTPGNAIKTRKDWSMNFMSYAAASFGKHVPLPRTDSRTPTRLSVDTPIPKGRVPRVASARLSCPDDQSKAA